LPESLKHIFLAATVFVFAWLLYSNTLNNPFLYDDLVIISGNENLKDASNLKHLFTKKYFRISGERSYRPVSTAAAFAGTLAGGGSPLAFRIISVTVHALCCVAVFFFIMLISRRKALAFTAALIFAAHPVHTEAVDGISFIEDPLSALLFFSALAAYAAARGRGSATAGAASAALSFLAMLAKESAAALPLCILLYEKTLAGERLEAPDVSTTGRERNRLIATHFAVLILFGIVRFVLMKHPAGGAPADLPGGGALQAFSFMAAAFLEYLRLFFLPYGLSVEHCLNASIPPAAASVVVSIIVHAGIAAFAAAALRMNRLMAFSLFFYLLNLLPISNIIPFGAVMAERYLYLPSFGLCLFFASVFLDEKERRRALGVNLYALNAAFLVCVALFMGNLTMRRNLDWSDGLVLWKKAALVCPQSSRARTNYGRDLIRNGDSSEAVEQLQEAVRIDPRHYEAWTSLGVALFNLGDYPRALKAYRSALAANPSNDVRYNIAILQLRTGDLPGAVRTLDEMLRTQPDWPAANYLMGNAQMRLGNADAAENLFLKTLSLDPGFTGAKGNLAILYMNAGRLDDAEKLFIDILNAEPGNETAARNLLILRRKRMESIPGAAVKKP